jgi:DNA-binding NarL/FixJ family response regulator
VLVADDDDAFVATVRTLLENAGYDTVAACSGDDALSLAREERPAVVLLDIDLPGLNGYEVCQRLRTEFGRGVAIAFLSGTRTESLDVSSGLLLGADDYIVKPFDPDELLARVSALARRAVGDEQRAGGNAGLTPREHEILTLLAEGLDQAEIAHKLSISPKTVGTHIDRILGKLGVHSRAQAVAAAHRLGLTATGVEAPPR